jgi:histidine triad (HIT) family protein
VEDSIFTKIIKGEIPSHKVYEDDKTFVFLDIHPFTPGHVLVVPKTQIDHFDDLPEEDYQAIFEAVKKVAKRLKEVLGPQRVCLRVEGFDVSHAHVHVYPCNEPADFYGPKDRAQIEPDHKALSEMAKKLAF